jgi:hypothetical protein
MTNLWMVLLSEFLKLRKSKIVFIGTVYFAIITAFMVYLMAGICVYSWYNHKQHGIWFIISLNDTQRLH